MAPLVADRLRHGSDIAAVFDARRRRGGRWLVVHARSTAARPVRVAVVASRRVGGAVQRNRAKRLLREAVRTLPLRAGLDVVLVARAAILEVGLPEVRAELERLALALDLLDDRA